MTVAAALGADAPELAVAKATVSCACAASASAEDTFTFMPFRSFGIEAFATEVKDESGNTYTQAGGHPFSAKATISLVRRRKLIPQNPQEKYDPVDHVKHVITDLPRGFAGNPLAPSELCEEVTQVLTEECPIASLVGGVDAELTGLGTVLSMPIYAVEPEHGVIAQFVFGEVYSETTYSITPHLRAADGYAITLEAAPVVEAPALASAEVTLCDFGAKGGVGPEGARAFIDCKKANESSPAPTPLITLPTRCIAQPPTTKLSVDSWENPGVFKSAEAVDPPLSGCDQVEFEPEIKLEPTSHRADSPTGMDVELSMPTDGLLTPGGIAQANLKGTTVLLPEGMTVNPAAGNGLGACASSQIGVDPATGVPNEAPVTCPDSSKIGTVEVDTPVLEDPLQGAVYIARQKDNPFGSLLALYLIFESKERGILIKLAGKVTSDPDTGRLEIGFTENPEAPFSSVKLHFPQSERAPLITPPACGSYGIQARMSPWNAQDPQAPTAAETVTQTTPYEVTEGPNGGSCPSGGLNPILKAGSVDPVAGATSPFLIELRREDGSQRFRALNISTPPGLSAYLKGVPYCPDAVLVAIPSAEGTGQAEIDHPSCPAASQIGTAQAGAGGGANPLYVDTGKVYLAGPYKGAPLSIAIVTPAVAGPFDLGNVVVRSALRVNPKTAQITAVSDPIPTIVHGIVLNIRDVRVAINRPRFMLNPTDCEPMSVSAEVNGAGGGTASVSDRYQVGQCEKLGFKPNLQIRLHGGTKRTDYQRLEATLTARPGDANIARAAVALPHSQFLAQEHIRTVCTRVQFAANACPKGSIYGSAEAVTPLLAEPLKGPVYLRSSDNPLPDLVVALRGPDSQPIEVELAGRTDSVHGGIRNTFDVVPDAPVSKFTLKLLGGQKSLIINSRDLCKGKKQRATVRFSAQNGMTRNFRPEIVNDCGKDRKGAERNRSK